MDIKIVTLSGASGSGKSSYCRNLLAADGRFGLIESHTTRPPRSKDLDGEYVHDAPDFFQDRGRFLWVIEAHGHVYGTLKDSVARWFREPAGRVGVMHIVPECVPALRNFAHSRGAEALDFYCLSPDSDRLRSRMKRRIDRGDMTPEEAERRIIECVESDSEAYDSELPYLFIPANMTVSQAARHITTVIDALRGRERGRR